MATTSTASAAQWSPLVVVPASEVHRVSPHAPDALCGPHLLWELHPDTAVLRTGHVTYMMSLPDGVTFYRVILGANTQPEVLGALEGVLEASTVYAESERLLTNDKVNPHEAAAAAKVVERVAADKHSQVASAPQGTMVPGNPFAPGTHTPGIPEGAPSSAGPLRGNSFAPTTVIDQQGCTAGTAAGGGETATTASQPLHVEAEIWHRTPPGGGPPSPATSSAPAASNHTATTAAPSPPAGGRRMGGPPPSVAAAMGVPFHAPEGPAQGVPANTGPVAGGMPSAASGGAPQATGPTGGGAPGPFTSKKANKIYSQTEKAAQGVLVRASSYLARKASQGPPAQQQVPPTAPGVAPPNAHASSMQNRFNATKQLGWATGKLSSALAAGSSWLGGAAAKAVSNDQKPKRAEIAKATGDGLANLFRAMEEASGYVVRAEEQAEIHTSTSTTAAAARGGDVPQSSSNVFQGPSVVIGTPCNLEENVAVGVERRAQSRANMRECLGV